MAVRIKPQPSPILTKHILTAEQEDSELYLAEDEDFIYLMSRKDPALCVKFSAMGAPSDQIREAAENILRKG